MHAQQDQLRLGVAGNSFLRTYNYLTDWKVHVYGVDVTDDLTREQAAAEVVRAGLAASQVHSRARWMGVYFAVFGVFFGAATLLLGLVQPLALRMVIFSVCLPVLLAAMVWWSLRQGAVPRGRLRGLWAWISTGVLYAVALVVGLSRWEGQAWFWVPAAIIVALPLCVAGWRERRR